MGPPKKPEKVSLAKSYGETLKTPEANKECLDIIKESLLDPTSFSLTTDFSPDYTWIEGEAFETKPIWVSAKALAINRGGNIAPFEAICRYNVDNGNLSSESYEMYSGF